MNFELLFTEQAYSDFKELEKNKNLFKRFKAVRKTLGLIETNPRHPGLNTHKYDSLKGLNGEEIFEAYAENNTSAAYRVFWHYGPDKSQITVIAITPHP